MFQIDENIFNFIYNLRNAKITGDFIFFSHLGDWQVIVGLSIIAIAILLLFRKQKETIFFAIALISGEVIKEFLKFLIQRPRPHANLALIQENGYSFPSGHALMSVIFYGMICYFIYQECKNKWQRIILIVATTVLIFLIGFSRVYLGVHWISDIWGGWLIGGAILAFFIIKLKNIKS